MNLHTLKPAEGATHRQGKRLGRGNSSGKGGTSTKGNKGAQSRAGYNQRRGSEGGQMPIHRRLPKRGFKNINRISY
jgi:large subunit ribosomal protein L15